MADTQSYVVPQCVQFGTYLSIDRIAELEQTIYILQVAHSGMIKDCVARDNSIQEEKDIFIKQMTEILEKNKQQFRDETGRSKIQYDSLQNKYDDLQRKYELLQNKPEIVDFSLQNKYDDLQRKYELLKNKPKMIDFSVQTEQSGEVRSLNTKLKNIEQLLKNNDKSFKELSKEVEDEKEISQGLRETIKKTAALIHKERELRIDFQELTDVLKTYLEVQIMRMSVGLENKGLSGFADAAVQMYEGYREGKLDKLINEVVKKRLSEVRSTESSVNLKTTLKKLSNKKK
jgi:hypothetical protein